ncbi:MAG: hypothetical protein ACRDHE_10840, partial [Ktedonobacterales bacterium]
MWEQLRRRFARQQHSSEVNPQTTVPSAQPPELSDPSNPAPPLAADNSPGAATDDNVASQQVLDLEAARAAAQEIAASAYLLAQLSPTEQEAVRGLLADDPTPEQIAQGKAALVALKAALVALSDLEERRGNVLKKMLPAILRAWYSTPSWPASRRWLKDLLIEIPAGGPTLLEAAAEYLRSAGADESGAFSLAQHADLLLEARRVGVDAAYHAIIGEDAFPQPDVSEPSSKRKVELRAKYEENVRVGKPPYAGVVIRTRGEVKWIVRQREWRTEATGDIETSEQVIDLRDVGIDGA